MRPATYKGKAKSLLTEKLDQHVCHWKIRPTPFPLKDKTNNSLQVKANWMKGKSSTFLIGR